MKKTSTKKLSLHTQTIRALTPKEVSAVAGGGFIMKDTVIIPRR
jgi:hypothetical protein